MGSRANFDTIRKYTLEEAYEVFDAIERRDFAHLAEELGDLLLQVLFYAEMAANEGRFSISDVLDHLNRKLIRRHPHVFGEEASRAAGNQADVDAEVEGSSARVLRNWEDIKAAEKTQARRRVAESRLDSVQRAMPALAEAAKLGSKAAKAGFDWPNWRDLLPKVAEETAELEAEASSDEPARKSRDRVGTWRSAFHGREPGPAPWRRRGDGVARLQSSLPSAVQRNGAAPRSRSKSSPAPNWKSFGRRQRQSSKRPVRRRRD